MSRETVLKRMLSTIKNEYDYIIIDCQPSLGVLVLNALVAADGVIIPAQTQEFSRKALKAITDIIGQVQATINPNLKLLGILLTIADDRLSEMCWLTDIMTRKVLIVHYMSYQYF